MSLPGLGGGDGVGGVPVVGRDDEDAVDVRAGQELPEIAVAGAGPGGLGPSSTV